MDKIGMHMEVDVEKKIVCQKCGAEVVGMGNGYFCVACGSAHAKINGKWVYTGGGRK